MKLFLCICSILMFNACTIETISHSDGYTPEDLRIAKCGMGIDSHNKPAIQTMIDTNPKIKAQYEKCLNELSH